ncbi:VOC family protein [Beijerinckia indica]|uniref:Glyoxalase/bleomycin resistance protein/dioxygenase n=1 Tax=Beijerinckia indica subsp. indica (strain ATCC 9039 / DSM 1715 / NCIMB 8712) TaxID=395963 RepID=B2IEZ2_BEII9|nr:VOC family protein [Beijerinckia indica]ACB94183.1 Glyoxalase/bleomycin resistance protein/dioxygenase [Beijerinckia indica subsp. indica ATCC 9039]
MNDTNILLLYVADAPASARFYAELFGIEPVEASQTFALFILPSGLALGLWGKADVQPAPVAGGGGSEIGFKVKGAEEIDNTHANWLAKGATIAFPPTDLDFGRSFVALDPDGHRLRVYAAAEKM